MGNDLSSQDYLKQLQSTIMQDSWLEGVYGKNKADQQNELKKVFNVIADNNVSATEKNALEARKETLKEKVERLEAKMAVLEEEMAKIQDEVDQKANEISDLVTSAEGKSNTLENYKKDWTKKAIEDVFAEYEEGWIQKDGIVSEIRYRLQSDAKGKRLTKDVEDVISKLNKKQNEVSGLVNDVTKLIDQKKLLENQYGATKSTYEFININLNKIGSDGTSFTNLDANTTTPIYSLEKTGIVTNLFENSNYNVIPGTNTNYKEGSAAPTTVDFKEKYGKYYTTGATKGVDKNSTKNVAVKNLGAAINAGLLDDMKTQGLSGKQIVEFLTENFVGVNMKINNNGSISIPKGHGSAAKKIFSKVTDFINNYDSRFYGPVNTWDKEQGNTISTNKQLKSLSQNYKTILEQLGTKEPKFTFKEAMFALFNPDTGLFKNSGVNYDLSKQGNGPNYSITPGGDGETAKMYKGLADKIYEIWGVKASNERVSADNFDEKDDSTPTKIKRTDPLSFKGADGTQYSFYVDKDKNGVFDGANEFVGGTGDWIADLKALDKDGNGILEGDELSSLKMLGTKYTDNAKTRYEDNKYLRDETTQIQYNWTNAKEMGIDKIDLNTLGEANKSTGKYDINNSEIFEDSFSFKINGQDYTASRKDETNIFMDTIYGNAFGRSETIGLTSEDADKLLNKNYGEYEQFAAKFNDTNANINVIKNAGQIAKNTQDAFTETQKRIQNDENAQLLRASNKAGALHDGGEWSKMSAEVQNIAIKEGLTVEMEQLKGIYMNNGNLDARGVVNKYKEQIANENKIKEGVEFNHEVWSAIIEGAKQGVDAKPAIVRELLSSGEAKNAKEAVAKIIEKYPMEEQKITYKTLDFDSEREKEIKDAFDKVFGELGQSDKTVEALYALIVAQQEDPNFMNGKTGEQLANEILQKMQ